MPAMVDHDVGPSRQGLTRRVPEGRKVRRQPFGHRLMAGSDNDIDVGVGQGVDRRLEDDPPPRPPPIGRVAAIDEHERTKGRPPGPGPNGSGALPVPSQLRAPTWVNVASGAPIDLPLDLDPATDTVGIAHLGVCCPGTRQRGMSPNQWRCQMPEPTPPEEQIVLAHFIVSNDVERSRRFYTEVLGGRVVFSGEVTYVALSNSWIIINVGGGPTDDKPSVTLQTPTDPDRVSSFLNIRVADIHAVYAEWSARGAQFLTPPKQHEYEIRCYIRDPDGHLIEVGQTTDPEGDWSPAHWPSSTPGGSPA
jgi:catechol 2,3-dioxygenase-like lactoylglutathione lyase family enzyme